MKKRRVGSTALEITEVSFGGAAVGGLYRACPRETAMQTLQVAWDAGLRYFDTAPFYGFGLSERRFGDFLRDKPRDSYVLSTKVGRLLRPVPEDRIPDHSYVDPLPFAPDYDYSYDGIMRSVEFSYARLGLNRIDILFVHDIGVYTHGVEKTKLHFRQFMDGGLKALEELKIVQGHFRLRPWRQRGTDLSRCAAPGAARLHPARQPLFAARPHRRSRIAAALPATADLADHRWRLQLRHPGDRPGAGRAFRLPAGHRRTFSTASAPWKKSPPRAATRLPRRRSSSRCTSLW